jgi:hypothetical protein
MKAKIFTLLVLGILFSSVSLCRAQNILTNGDFSNPASIAIFDFTQKPLNTWCTFVNNFTTEVSEGVCKYDIVDGGINTYDIQLIQWGFPLELGKHYRLSFEVKADADRDFGVYIGQDGDPWINLNANYTQHATANWEIKTIEFDATSVFPLHKLSFEMGKSNIDMYFRNIMLQVIPNVWLTGSAFGGWVASGVIPLSTTDGVTYTATNIEILGDGGGTSEFKFTEGTWPTAAGPLGGPPGWPSGIASVTDGGSPNMQGVPGFWNVTYNYISKAYSFTPGINPYRAVSFEGSSFPAGAVLSTTDGMKFSRESLTVSAGTGQFVEKPSSITPSPTANWSNVDFPIGMGTQDGSLIAVAPGTYNVNFDISTGFYNFQPPLVSIIGDFSGWWGDVDMTTTDNITWTLSGIVFYSGGILKFRDNHNWNYNYGSATGTEFPTGTGISISPYDIPYEAGTYDITFNRTTLAYTFTAICFPTLLCPSWVQENTDPGKCGAVVNYPEVVADVTCGDEGIIIKQTAGLSSGSFFPVGYTWNAFELTNAEGYKTSCGFYVNVSDPPKIKNIPDLWPANHKMVPIHLDLKNNCSDNVTVLYYYIYNITSNEPDNGLGDGDVANDWQIDMYGQNLLLRAERSGKGKGRIYSFNVQGYDESYNWFDQIVTVTVPHDKGKEISVTTKPATNHKSSISGNPIENLPFASKVWPNPSTNSFNLEVQSTSDEKVVLTVFDINGRLLSNLNANSNQTTSFGKDLKAGTYLILVRQGNNSNTIKVVKQ